MTAFREKSPPWLGYAGVASRRWGYIGIYYAKEKCENFQVSCAISDLIRPEGLRIQH